MKIKEKIKQLKGILSYFKIMEVGLGVDCAHPNQYACFMKEYTTFSILAGIMDFRNVNPFLEENKDDNIHKSEALERQDKRKLTLVQCQN